MTKHIIGMVLYFAGACCGLVLVTKGAVLADGDFWDVVLGFVFTMIYARWFLRELREARAKGKPQPIVLQRPEELGGLSWDDQGGDLLAPTEYGIRMYPPATDWFDMTSDDARELAAHLAAIADVHDAARKGGSR